MSPLPDSFLNKEIAREVDMVFQQGMALSGFKRDGKGGPTQAPRGCPSGLQGMFFYACDILPKYIAVVKSFFVNQKSPIAIRDRICYKHHTLCKTKANPVNVCLLDCCPVGDLQLFLIGVNKFFLLPNSSHSPDVCEGFVGNLFPEMKEGKKVLSDKQSNIGALCPSGQEAIAVLHNDELIGFACFLEPLKKNVIKYSTIDFSFIKQRWA